MGCSGGGLGLGRCQLGSGRAGRADVTVSHPHNHRTDDHHPLAPDHWRIDGTEGISDEPAKGSEPVSELSRSNGAKETNMNITVIGRGNVGGALAGLWERAGHTAAAMGRGGGDASDADVVFVAVPSGAIPK